MRHSTSVAACRGRALFVRRAIEAIAGDRALDQVTGEAQADFVGAFAGGADEVGAARGQRLDRADADPRGGAERVHFAFGQSEVHRAAHPAAGPGDQARIAAATRA